MKPLADFLAVARPKPKATSERAECIRFFHERLKDKKGKPFSPRMLGVRLAHFSISELYAIQSVFKDISNRNGSTAAQKYFWWVSKTEKETAP